MQAIWDEFFRSWIAENGLAKLVGDEKYPQAYDGLGFATPANDNGILFLAYFLVISKAAGNYPLFSSKRLFVGTTIERLVRLPFRGLFDRKPIGTDESLRTPEMHDNYVGISVLSSLYGLDFAKEILSYGVLHGCNYNNLNPGKWELKYQRHGGEITLYSILAGTPPQILDFLWLCGGLILNMFDMNVGRTNLTWLRLYGIDRADIKQGWVKFPLLIISEFWKIMKWMRFTSLENLMSKYFSDKHPITKMAKHMGENNWGF